MDKTKNNTTTRAIIANVIIGLGLIGAGIYFYLEILKMEQEGGSLRLNRLLWLIYDITGALGVLGFFLASGGYIIFNGYSLYKKKKNE